MTSPLHRKQVDFCKGPSFYLNFIFRAYTAFHWILKLLCLKNLFIAFISRQQELLPNWLHGGRNLWKAVTWIIISTG